MGLPAYDKAVVDLNEEEHKHSQDLYDAIKLTQERLSDGLGLDDLFAIPEIVGKSQGAVNWIVKGDAGDPNDDAAIGARIEAVGHAMVRAGQFLAKAPAEPTEPIV